MKYLVNTITNHILQEAIKCNDVVRFVLPSYSSIVLLNLGLNLEEAFNRVSNKRIRFIYGIAYNLGKEWSLMQDKKIKKDFNCICSKGWYNESNNMTSLRNETKTADEDCLITLLAGYNHINDQAGLLDFYHLDEKTIWSICLKKTFREWIEDKLKYITNPADDEEYYNKISNLFEIFYENGITDLFGISNFLEESSFFGVMDGNDAYLYVLHHLGYFKLPSMTGLARTNVNRTPQRYVTSAQEFFNYSMFLDSSSRRKILKKIDRYKDNKVDSEIIDDLTLGKLKSVNDLIDTLKDFIENRSYESSKLLKTADYIYIYDSVLGYKEKKAEKSIGTKKLYGLAPEVFLRALWFTLSEYKKENKSKLVFIAERLEEITLTSILFKHDFGTGEESEVSDDREVAKDFLKKILGGIDEYFEQNVYLEFGEEDNKKKLYVKSLISSEGENDFLEYSKSSTAEPYLEFKILLKTMGVDKTFERQYRWMLSQNHQCRIMANMYTWVFKKYKEHSNILPVFGIPYFGEIFMSRDEGEVNRLLEVAMNSKHCEMVDLLDVKDIEQDNIRPLLVDLSFSYQDFVREFNNKGFFHALENSYEIMRGKYTIAYETYLEKSKISVLGPMLLKAFYMVNINDFKDTGWVWNEYLPCGIITPLHPILLEMIKHQHSFLCDSFCEYAKLSFQSSYNKAFLEKQWDRVYDLAKIQWPVFGTIKDESFIVNTNVRGFNYFHLVGDCDEKASFITTRTLLEYDADEDDIMDSDLFRETQESQLIEGILSDYQKVHVHAKDGISIGAYCGKSIQPVIAGVDRYLTSIEKNRENKLYYFKLVIFTDSMDDSAIMNWINAWKDRWQVAEFSSGKQHYKNCRISISYRIVKKENNYEQFKKLMRSTNLDVMFLSNYIEPSTSDFTPIGSKYQVKDGYRKFPILEKFCCRLMGGGREKQRERILSNQRFVFGSLHAEAMCRLKYNHISSEQRHAMIIRSDFTPWEELINDAHKSSAWVVCIDPVVDEDLLKTVNDEGINVREIIGFGTGVGAYGENNYTISTEQFTMVDIKNRISSQISSRLGPMTVNDSQAIADSLVNEASAIAGLSVVKATGPSEYVRDYIAYSLVRKLLIKDNKLFCDELISLDAYKHWFNSAPNAMRPDLLRLQAKIINGKFEITAQVIECKIAQQSDGYLEKAREQLENGVKHLVSIFNPRQDHHPVGIYDDNPDQIYWWAQLQRLISSKGYTTKQERKDTLTALERISEGIFNITWQAFAIAIWTDLDNDEIKFGTQWALDLQDKNMQIYVATTGRRILKKACLEGVNSDLFSNISSCTFQGWSANDGKSVEIESNKKDDKNYIEEKIIKLNDSKIETKNNTCISKDKVDLVAEMKKMNGNDDIHAVTDEKSVNIYQAISSDEKRIHVTTSKKIPERILLGSGTLGGRDSYWEFGHNDLPNRHILVFGASGTGKTYTIQALLCELNKYGQNSLIVDYTNGFTTSQLDPIVVEKLDPKQHIVRKEPLPINPFRQQCEIIDDIELEEEPSITAQRVNGVFDSVYNIGDQQKSALYSAIRDGILENKNNFPLKELLNKLVNIRNAGGPSANPAASVISKIQPFIDMNPFGEEVLGSWEGLYTDEFSRLHIIQLAGFMKDTARLITEFSLFDLYWYYRAQGNKDNPKVVVLDEIQNLDHRLESPLGQLLTEGRKFGISLILATQTLSNLGRDERDRLFQASHKLFFKPADTEVRFFAQILEDSVGEDGWVERLSSLKRGECYSLGPALNEMKGKLEPNRCFRIRIKALEDRF